MQSQQAPRKKAADEKCHGQRQSAGGTTDTSAQGSSGVQPTDTYKRYHWHRNDAGNRTAPQSSSNRGPGPSQRRNSGVGRRHEHQADSRVEHRRAYSPQQSAGPSHGRNTDGSVGPTNGNEAHSSMGPWCGSGRPCGSAPRPGNFPDGRHPVRPVLRRDGLDHQPLWAVRSPSRQRYSDRGSGPYYHWRNGGVGQRQQDQVDSHREQRRAYHLEHSAGPSHGRNTDGSVGPMHGNQTHSSMGPRRESGQPSGSAPRPQNFPDGRHPMRPVASKDGLGHQPLRAMHSPSQHPYSDCRPRPYHWCNSGVGRRQQDQADSRREHRHAYHPHHSAGPSQGHKLDGNVRPTHGNQTASGRRHGTGQPCGSAPRPGNLTDGRHPVWAVPGKDWLSLLPNTEEPMEVDPPQDVEEPMEVDPPRPEQTWDYRGASLLSAIRAQKQRRKSARPAPYSSSHRLHPKY